MTDEILLLVDETKENMAKAEEAMKNDFSAIRTGLSSNRSKSFALNALERSVMSEIFLPCIKPRQS